MTIRKFITLALATVLVWNCSGLRAAEHQSAENTDVTINNLAAELAKAEQQAPVVPAPVVEAVPAQPEAPVTPAAPAVPTQPESPAAPAAPTQPELPAAPTTAATAPATAADNVAVTAALCACGAIAGTCSCKK